jgi:hypothetical protein
MTNVTMTGNITIARLCECGTDILVYESYCVIHNSFGIALSKNPRRNLARGAGPPQLR